MIHRYPCDPSTEYLEEGIHDKGRGRLTNACVVGISRGDKRNKSDQRHSSFIDYIINNVNYFDERIALKEPVNIYLDNNRPVKATKVGNVISYFEAFGRHNEINTNKVFYAKEMSANLISLGKLTDSNNTVIQKEILRKLK